MKRLLVSLILIFSISCGEDDISYFQANDPEPEYSLFNLLDNYPALKSAFDPIDQRVFNNHLADAVNSNLTETKDILGLVDKLMLDPEHPVTDLIVNSRSMLNRIIRQDNIDLDSVSRFGETSDDYAGDFFHFYDLLADGNLGLSSDFITIANKSMGYIQARYGKDEVEQIMSDIIAFLKDDEGQNLGSILELMSDIMGKLLFQANENMWLDSVDSLITDRVRIMEEGAKNTGLGNSARGIESFLTGINDVLKNVSIRDDIYDILREAGNLAASSVEGKKLYGILKYLICNIEDYFTQGGSVYSSANSDYNQNSNEVYVNAELGNTLKELFPALITLFIRGDRADSIIADDGTKLYPLEIMAKSLNRADIDVNSLNFEKTLYNLVRYDAKGRDRLTNTAASNISYLERLVYVLNVASNFGYLDGGDTGEGNHGHGHGQATGGILTLNDCLFNLTTGYILDVLGAYNLCLDPGATGGPHGKYIHRSNNSFNTSSFSDPVNVADYGDRPFLMDPDFPALQLMSGETVGDAGHPDGGSGAAEYNSFRAYSEDGLGEGNTARWIMGWIARVCWEGEGPYYAKGQEDSSKYKDEWNTDYYLIQLPEGAGPDYRHYAPNVVNPSNDKEMLDTNEAGCLTVNELINLEDNRECDTWEEAIYRNFQWLLYEKKFVLVIPLRIDLGVLARAAIYLVVESNGIAGLINAKKNDNNGQWLVDGGYGESSQPADVRFSILLGGAEGIVGMNLIMNDVIGNGSVMPDVFKYNISPIYNMGFFTDDTITSRDVDPNNPEMWENRNALLPILAALIGGLHEHTVYNEKYPLKTITDGLLPLLVKPMFFYQKNSGNSPYNCWKPRLEDGNNYLKPAVDLDAGVDLETYYMPKDNATLLTILSESSYKKCDGVIPLLNQARLLTPLLSLLKRFGGPEFDDPEGTVYDDSFESSFLNWGARRKMFYGLEQIFSTIKTSRGELLASGYMNMSFPDWIFFADDSDLRQEDIRFDAIIDEIIGTDTSGKGIAVFPDNRPNPEDWNNFYRLIDASGEMMSNKGISEGRYNIIEDIIAVMDKLFREVNTTNEDIRGLCHTMGSVFTAYNESRGIWEYPGELGNILNNELPELLEVFQGHYWNLLILMDSMMSEGGFLEYLFGTLHSSYSSRDVFTQLYDFIGTEIISRHDSYLWNDMAELLNEFADMIITGNRSLWGFYGFTGSIGVNNDILENTNPFRALGELLSR